MFSVLFHTYTCPLIEAFGTPFSVSNCTSNWQEEARNRVQRGTASFSWHLLAIEQCREKKDKKISVGNYFSRGKFCIKVLFKMTGLLKYLYQSSLIKIDISLSLLIKRAL